MTILYGRNSDEKSVFQVLGDLTQEDFTKNNIDHFHEFKEIATKKYKEVIENREEILSAFVAKYGCQPDEIEQAEIRYEDGTICWFPIKRSALIGNICIHCLKDKDLENKIVRID